MSCSRKAFFALSLVVHGAFALGIGELEVEKSRAATAIEIAEVEKPVAPPPPAALDSPRKPEPPAREKRAASPKPADSPPPKEVPPAAPPIDDAPDFGLSLSGGVDGAGIALPLGGSTRQGAREPSPRRGPKKVLAAAPTPERLDPCQEPPAKPRPRSVPQPAGTEAARAAGVEGKVRVALTVDESGRVVDVKLLQGLGYGLDEAALAAARRAEFEPAVRCGKPVRAAFNISMRFTL